MEGVLDAMKRRLGFGPDTRKATARKRKRESRQSDGAPVMVYRHEYEGGYEEYRAAQITGNTRSLEKVFADEETLGRIVEHLGAHGILPPARGLCHGSRNGFEVEYFRKALGGDTIGTDISDTALQYPNLHVWDFHDENDRWAGAFDFVYSNALDHAFDPERALRTWTRQLRPGGLIYVEHTPAHGPDRAGRRDPFGAHPLAMPYLLFKWGRDAFRLVDIMELDRIAERKRKVWVFVLAPGPVRPGGRRDAD